MSKKTPNLGSFAEDDESDSLDRLPGLPPPADRTVALQFEFGGTRRVGRLSVTAERNQFPKHSKTIIPSTANTCPAAWTDHRFDLTSVKYVERARCIVRYAKFQSVWPAIVRQRNLSVWLVSCHRPQSKSENATDNIITQRWADPKITSPMRGGHRCNRVNSMSVVRPPTR